MTAQIITHRDILLRMARRVAVVVCVSAGLAWAMSLLLTGADKDTSARIVFLTASIVVALSALLAGVMSYQSGQLLRTLTLTRAELWRLSRTDQLTGLLNRRGFDEAAISALETAYGANLPAVALMCDIDRFKHINDRFGHDFGDRVLVRFCEVLRAFADETGVLIARHGGEEFVALMIGVSAEQAVLWAEALRQACASSEVSDDEVSVRITVSIGLAALQEKLALSEILRIADQALFSAKNGGRNRVEKVLALARPIAA